MHRLLFGVFFLLLVGLNGCTTSEVTPPEDLIPKDQMAQILADVCKVEARFQRRMSVQGKSPLDIATSNYAVVFENSEVTVNQFRSSYEYYEKDPEVMRELFDEVIIILKKEQSLLLEGNQKQTEE